MSSDHAYGSSGAGPSGASTVCRYFVQQGKCFYGAECKFEHIAPAGAPDVAQPAAAQPAPVTIKSSLAAHAGAKEWTPASAAPAPSPSPTAGSSTLKLNPNKTPFKPGGGGSSSNSGSKLTSRVAEFVPQDESVGTALHFGDMSMRQQDESGVRHPLEEDDDEQQLQYGMGGAMQMDSHNPYAPDQSPFDGADMSHLLAAGGAMQQAAGGGAGGSAGALQAEAEEFVPQQDYTSYDDFATHALPVGGSIGRVLQAQQAEGMPRQRGAAAAAAAAAGGGMFMDDPLRTRLALLSHLHVSRLQPDDPQFSALPVALDHDRYHSLLPLPADEAPAGLSNWYAKTPGAGSVCYKVISAVDGRAYVVKRLLGCRLSEEQGRAAIQPWLDFSSRHGTRSAPPSSPHASLSRSWGPGPAHPSIVALRGAFSSKEFGNEGMGAAATHASSSASAPGAGASVLCLVYDYHPTAGALHPAEPQAPLSTELMWHYALQLLGAVAALHDAKLVAAPSGMLLPGRVLVTGDHRLRLNGCGLHECVGPHVRQSDADLARAQLGDLRALGALLLGWLGYGEQAASLASLHSTPPKPAGAAAAAAASYHSALASLRPELERQAPRDLFDFLWALLTRADLTAPQAQMMVAPQLQRALTTQYSHGDYLEGEMGKELQNGRLFRLMVKLGFVTDRPDVGDGPWSDTGERYLLSLYRDLVFHSVHGGGVPNLDWGHVVHQLNLLDAAAPEKTMLSSRSGDAMMLVRYADLKNAVEEAYQELLRKQHEGLGAGHMAFAGANSAGGGGGAVGGGGGGLAQHMHGAGGGGGGGVHHSGAHGRSSLLMPHK